MPISVLSKIRTNVIGSTSVMKNAVIRAASNHTVWKVMLGELRLTRIPFNFIPCRAPKEAHGRFEGFLKGYFCTYISPRSYDCADLFAICFDCTRTNLEILYCVPPPAIMCRWTGGWCFARCAILSNLPAFRPNRCQKGSLCGL